MEWIDGNLGSRLTMKYPAVYMMEPGARGEILSIAFASAGQHQDAGAKVVHCAPNTSSRIISKSISKNGGRASYRGLVKMEQGAQQVEVERRLRRLDPRPQEPQRHVSLHRDRRAGRLGRPRGQRLADRRRAVFYLTSRGLSEAEASTMIVSGFIEPLVKELPMEYAVEMNRLIELQMEGTVGWTCAGIATFSTSRVACFST